MLEAMGALNQAIASGKLPQPRRSIRILAMGEMYGSMHYVASHPERMKQTVAALCIDTPAAPYEQAGTEYTFHFNPHAAASFVDAFILKVAGAYYGARPSVSFKGIHHGHRHVFERSDDRHPDRVAV